MRTVGLVLAVAAAALAWSPAASAHHPPLKVVVLPVSDLRVLETLARRGAVGLLVPDAGPKTSGARARASLVRGEVRNSLRGGLPEGRVLIELEEAGPPEDLLQSAAIFVGLPRGGEQANDRRYPIAVVAPGYRGVLESSSTRIPGLVSVVDVAATALRARGALTSRAEDDAADYVFDLDERIDENGSARTPAAALVAVLIVVLAFVFPRAAVVAFAVALAANLALGVAGISEPWAVVPAVALAVGAGSPFVARAVRSPLALGLTFAGVLAAYLVAFAIDQSWLSLSPLGPTQNARFYGLSNLLETLLLVPALAAAALLHRRVGFAGFAAVALLTLVMVAGSRFGADGGGAVVLAAGYSLLGVLLAGGGRRAALAGIAGAAVAVGAGAADALLGPSTHVGASLRGGPDELAGDIADRVTLSWERATAGWLVALAVLASVVALAVLVSRVRRETLPRGARALLYAFALAVAVSLLANDSPKEVAVGGLVGFVALARWLAARPEDAPRLESTQPLS